MLFRIQCSPWRTPPERNALFCFAQLYSWERQRRKKIGEFKVKLLGRSLMINSGPAACIEQVDRVLEAQGRYGPVLLVLPNLVLQVCTEMYTNNLNLPTAVPV